jgi:hypothetical protein
MYTPEYLLGRWITLVEQFKGEISGFSNLISFLIGVLDMLKRTF